MAASVTPRVSHRGARYDVPGVVYVIKLARPLGNLANKRSAARYYVGWTERDPKRRLAGHRAGFGAKMLRAAAERGIRFRIIAVLPGTKRLERRIKDYHNTPELVRVWKARGICGAARA